MIPTPTLPQLLQLLDERLFTYSTLDAYYSGSQPLAFLSPEAREALGTRFGRMASNLPRLAVTSLAERLRVTGFTGVDVWDDYLRNDLDQQAGVCHREALALGTAYAIVWADDAGRAKVTMESARQVAVVKDPGTRRITSAIKRWETLTSTEAVLYEADKITRYRSNQPGSTTTGFEVVEIIANPLGMVPVVQFCNSDRLLDDGVSEMADLLPLVDGLNKTLSDLLVSSEYFARPRRWASGIELVENEETGEIATPFPEGHRMMISEAPESKFGQLAGADLGAYESAVRVLLGQIMAVSALPAHYVGIFSDNPSSADALRAAEASLAARAEARQQTFGRSWEDVARLIVGVRDAADPATVEARVTWADPSTRSLAQESDAVTKLFGSGLLPASYALAKLGYSESEIAAIRIARRADAAPTVELVA